MSKFSGCTILGGPKGNFTVHSQKTIVGIALAPVSHILVTKLGVPAEHSHSWRLQGVISNIRYAEKAERAILAAKQEGLGRSDCDCAALLPIKKTDAWWNLAQDERRKIFEDQSRHIEANLKYLPAIARQLYHSRDFGEEFDFLTWFEYRSEHQALFDEMIHAFRKTEEWKYVEREIDFRLIRVPVNR